MKLLKATTKIGQYSLLLLLLSLIISNFLFVHAQLENGAIQAKLDIETLNALLFKTFKLFEHEDFKDQLKFDVNFEKSAGFLYSLNIKKIDISSYVAPSEIKFQANKKDKTLELIVENAGFNLDCDMTIDLFGLNFMKDFSIGIQELEYSIILQQIDPETIRLVSSEIQGVKFDHIDTSGFIMDKLLSIEKFELNELLFVLIKLQPPQLKNFINDKINEQIQLSKQMIQHLSIDQDSILDLTSFTELISEVDDQSLYINLAGWFENSRIHGKHPLDIGEGYYPGYIRKDQTEQPYQNQIAIHQSMIASLLNTLASTNKVFTIGNKGAIDQLSSLIPEFKTHYNLSYDLPTTYEIQISLHTQPDKPVVQIQNRTISIGRNEDFGLEFALIANQNSMKQVAFKFKMDLQLVLETYLHNQIFDLNILSFDIKNVQQITNNCGIYSRDYEGLFETLLQIVKQQIDNQFKDGQLIDIFQGPYASYKKELGNLEFNHSFFDQFLFIGF